MYLLYLRSAPHFNDKQLDRLSEFCANLALVFIGSVLIPFFTGGQQFQLNTIVQTAILSLFLLGASMHLLRKED